MKLTRFNYIPIVGISVTFILGRVYSCTMLYLLNNRSKMRGEKADGTVEVGLGRTSTSAEYVRSSSSPLPEFLAN